MNDFFVKPDPRRFVFPLASSEGESAVRKLVDASRVNLARDALLQKAKSIRGRYSEGNYLTAKEALARADSALTSLAAFPYTSAGGEVCLLGALQTFRASSSEGATLDAILRGEASKQVDIVASDGKGPSEHIASLRKRELSLPAFLTESYSLPSNARSLAGEFLSQLPKQLLLELANRRLMRSGFVFHAITGEVMPVRGIFRSEGPWGMTACLVSGSADGRSYYSHTGLMCIGVDRWKFEGERIPILATINPTAIHETAHWVDHALGVASKIPSEEREYNAMMLAALFSNRFFSARDLRYLLEPYRSAASRISKDVGRIMGNVSGAQVMERAAVDLEGVHAGLELLVQARYGKLTNQTVLLPNTGTRYFDRILKANFRVPETLNGYRREFFARARAERIFLDLPRQWFSSDYRPPPPPPAAGAVAVRQRDETRRRRTSIAVQQQKIR